MVFEWWFVLLLLILLAGLIVLTVFVGLAYSKAANFHRRRGRLGPTGLQGVAGSATNTGATGITGGMGPTGSTGAQGIAGSATNTGATGPTGPVGLAGAGAIIPFASNTPVSLTTVIGGLADLGALIGFGGSVSSVDVSGVTIDLTGAPLQALNEAFDAPRAGTITAISTTVSNVSALVLSTGTATVTTQLYHADAGTNLFSALPGVAASVAFTGTLILGSIGNDLTTGLSVPMIAGDRYLMVTSVATTGVAVAVSFNGYVSAGLSVA